MKHSIDFNKKNKILVVDDEVFIRESIADFLKEFGFDIITSPDADDALRIFQSNDSLDIILTDIKMPGMSGIELLEKIHSLSPEKPVILMTAYAELDSAINAIRKGAFDFLIKPYRPEQLLNVIEKAIDRVRLQNIEKDYKDMLEETVKERTKDLINALNMIKHMSEELMQILTVVAEYRDEETGMHIKRVGLYAKQIAANLKMPEDFTDTISFACPMHDIGKVGIPDNILFKPGPLNEEEFNIMKKHPSIGAQILSGSKHYGIQMASIIALTHHERWDGTGYPNGLSGKQIPIEGRIAMICDQYDALRSKRPYRDSLSHETAFKIITEGDGRTEPKHFDPDVLKAFKEIAPILNEIYEQHKD